MRPPRTSSHPHESTMAPILKIAFPWILALPSCWIPVPQRTRLPLDGVPATEFQIVSQGVDVEVYSAPELEGSLRSLGDPNAAPTGSVAIHNSTVVIEATCVRAGPRCRGALQLGVPDGLRSEIDVVALEADVSVTETQGTLKVTANRGDVELRQTTGSVTLVLRGRTAGLHSVTGELDMHIENATLDTTDVATSKVAIHGRNSDLQLALTTQPRVVTATTFRGALDLSLPSGTYFLDAHSSGGSFTTNGVAHEPESPRRITIRSTRTEVLIDGYILEDTSAPEDTDASELVGTR